MTIRLLRCRLNSLFLRLINPHSPGDNERWSHLIAHAFRDSFSLRKRSPCVCDTRVRACACGFARSTRSFPRDSKVDTTAARISQPKISRYARSRGPRVAPTSVRPASFDSGHAHLGFRLRRSPPLFGSSRVPLPFILFGIEKKKIRRLLFRTMNATMRSDRIQRRAIWQIIIGSFVRRNAIQRSLKPGIFECK